MELRDPSMSGTPRMMHPSSSLSGPGSSGTSHRNNLQRSYSEQQHSHHEMDHMMASASSSHHLHQILPNGHSFVPSQLHHQYPMQSHHYPALQQQQQQHHPQPNLLNLHPSTSSSTTTSSFTMDPRSRTRQNSGRFAPSSTLFQRNSHAGPSSEVTIHQPQASCSSPMSPSDPRTLDACALNSPLYEDIDPNRITSHFEEYTCHTLGSGSSTSTSGMRNSSGIETSFHAREPTAGGSGSGSGTTSYQNGSDDPFLIQHHHHQLDGRLFERKLPPSESTMTFLQSQGLDPEKIEESISLVGFFFLILSFLILLIDTWTQVLLSYLYFSSKSDWFPATGIILFSSSLIINAVSLRWHLKDGANHITSKPSEGNPFRTFIHILVHLLLLGPVVRYCNLLKYGMLIRAEKQRKRRIRDLGRECRLSTLGPLDLPIRALRPLNDSFPTGHNSVTGDSDSCYVRFVNQDRDTAFLSILKSFLQSCPQLMLQSYIWTSSSSQLVASSTLTSPSSSSSPSRPLLESIQCLVVIVTLIHVSWSICSYTRAVRRLIPTKRCMTDTGTIIQFCWRSLTIGSRIMAIVLFTTKFGFWILPIAIAHWGVMTVWVMHQGTGFCYDSVTGQPKVCQEYLFNLVIGTIYLVCFISVKEEPTRCKYLFFYIVSLVETTGMTMLWYYVVDSTVVWYHLPAVVGIFGSFSLGIFFMMLYYRYFHPNGPPLWVNHAARCC